MEGSNRATGRRRRNAGSASSEIDDRVSRAAFPHHERPAEAQRAQAQQHDDRRVPGCALAGEAERSQRARDRRQEERRAGAVERRGGLQIAAARGATANLAPGPRPRSDVDPEDRAPIADLQQRAADTRDPAPIRSPVRRLARRARDRAARAGPACAIRRDAVRLPASRRRAPDTRARRRARGAPGASAHSAEPVTNSANPSR